MTSWRPIAAAIITGVALSSYVAGPVAAHRADEDVLTIDHYLSHTSTAPAIRGQRVSLYVRERVLADSSQHTGSTSRPAIMFVHGAALGSKIGRAHV